MQSTKIPDRRGVILEEKVDLDWLKSLEPKHNVKLKFDVNMKTRRVAVGMDAHKNYALEFAEDPTDVLGGFIDEETGELTWSSTLNIAWNLTREATGTTLREITDPSLIQDAKEILYEWIQL